MAINQTARTLWMKLVSDGKRFDSVLEKVRIISANNGQSTAEMTVCEEHSNRFGNLHGGCTATIVDMVSSLALLTHKRQSVGVSVDIHITYVKGAAVGQDIVIEANTLREGKNLAFLEVYIKKKKDGSLVAHGTHTKFIGIKTES